MKWSLFPQRSLLIHQLSLIKIIFIKELNKMQKQLCILFCLKHVIPKRMKKNLIYSLLIIITPLFFLSCNRNDNKECKDPFVESKNRTVLIYMAASNSLDIYNFTSADLEEMEEGIESVSDLEGCNILVYLQRGSSSARQTPKLLRLIKDPKTNKAEWVTIKEYEHQISTDPEVMGTVFRDMRKYYPANSYGLVLWSHADGWLEGEPKMQTRWFGEDKYEGVSYKMDILDLRKALSKVPKFDFILFDACLMQTIEVAYELKDHTHYMMGSPAEIPGPGAPYQEVIPVFFERTPISDLVKDIANSYYGYYKETYTGSSSGNYPWKGGVSMTVLDLTQVDRFAESMKAILKSNNSEYVDLEYSGVFYYDPGRGMKYYYTDIKSSLEGSNIPLSGAWKSSYSDFVTYFETTPTNYSGVKGADFSMKGANGVSMYIPRKGGDFFEENEYYNKLSWTKFIMN